MLKSINRFVAQHPYAAMVSVVVVNTTSMMWAQPDELWFAVVLNVVVLLSVGIIIGKIHSEHIDDVQ